MNIFVVQMVVTVSGPGPSPMYTCKNACTPMSLHDVNTYCRYRTSSAIVKAKVIMFVLPAGLLHFDVVGQQFADRGSKSLQVGYDRRVISMAEKFNQLQNHGVHAVQLMLIKFD